MQRRFKRFAVLLIAGDCLLSLCDQIGICAANFYIDCSALLFELKQLSKPIDRDLRPIDRRIFHVYPRPDEPSSMLASLSAGRDERTVSIWDDSSDFCWISFVVSSLAPAMFAILRGKIEDDRGFSVKLASALSAACT